jgi:hypothetical protein
MWNRRTGSVTVIAAGLALAACTGGDDDATSTTDTATRETTIETPSETTVVDATTTEPPATSTATTEPAVTAIDAGVELRQLDCAEQLPSYVEDRIPGGGADPRLTCWAMNTLEDYSADAQDADARRIDVTYYVWESAVPEEERSPDPIA